MLTFSCLPFHDLLPLELYEIIALRESVFVVEQNCPYLDADGKDPHCWHFQTRDVATGQLIAYTRLLPKGLSYADYASIGRVVSASAARGTGAGRETMRRSIAMCRHLFGDDMPIKIGAQQYLIRFYEGFGFTATGDDYLEDGIPHTKMILAAGH